MNTDYSYLLDLSIIHLPLLGMLTAHRLQRKATMRFLKKKAEGGVTLMDWNGGFIGISRSGRGWLQFRASYENCSCCKKAFDLSLEVLGFQLMVYNDGGPCEQKAFLLDFQENAIPRKPNTREQIAYPDLHLRPERLASQRQ